MCDADVWHFQNMTLNLELNASGVKDDLVMKNGQLAIFGESIEIWRGDLPRVYAK